MVDDLVTTLNYLDPVEVDLPHQLCSSSMIPPLMVRPMHRLQLAAEGTDYILSVCKKVREVSRIKHYVNYLVRVT